MPLLFFIGGLLQTSLLLFFLGASERFRIKWCLLLLLLLLLALACHHALLLHSARLFQVETAILRDHLLLLLLNATAVDVHVNLATT